MRNSILLYRIKKVFSVLGYTTMFFSEDCSSSDRYSTPCASSNSKTVGQGTRDHPVISAGDVQGFHKKVFSPAFTGNRETATGLTADQLKVLLDNSYLDQWVAGFEGRLLSGIPSISPHTNPFSRDMIMTIELGSQSEDPCHLSENEALEQATLNLYFGYNKQLFASLPLLDVVSKNSVEFTVCGCYDSTSNMNWKINMKLVPIVQDEYDRLRSFNTTTQDFGSKIDMSVYLFDGKAGIQKGGAWEKIVEKKQGQKPQSTAQYELVYEYEFLPMNRSVTGIAPIAHRMGVPYSVRDFSQPQKPLMPVSPVSSRSSVSTVSRPPAGGVKNTYKHKDEKKNHVLESVQQFMEQNQESYQGYQPAPSSFSVPRPQLKNFPHLPSQHTNANIHSLTSHAFGGGGGSV